MYLLFCQYRFITFKVLAWLQDNDQNHAQKLDWREREWGGGRAAPAGELDEGAAVILLEQRPSFFAG